MNKKTFPFEEKELKIAMLGMVDGNGHPYSWSAMFNGYDKNEMSRCPFAGIPQYLDKEPFDTVGISGAKVTHVWTDDPADAPKVAAASLIPNVIKRPEDAIGQVDAVIIATDKGYEHVDRCRPFVEAGIPVFVDKPLVDNEEDLLVFCDWVNNGAKIMSSSCMRYCKEYMPYRLSTNELGELRYLSTTTPKSWERYGIHALEGIYPITGPGFLWVINTGDEKNNIVHLKHETGADVVIAAINDMYGSFGVLSVCGTKDHAQVSMKDSYYAFKSQLVEFVNYLRTGILPFPFSETVELMKIVIAGIRSRDENRKIDLSEIKGEIK